MSTKPKVLVFAGSLRKSSFNKKLVKIAEAGAKEAGADTTFVDLADFDLPIFNQDNEDANGLPSGARKLKDLMLSHDGFLVSAPEYNSSITAALKNAIDWASRPVQGEGTLACFKGKVVGLMSASPGALGGLRGLVHVRAIFNNIFSLVIPEQVAVSKANEAFNDDGSLKDAKQQQAVMDIGRNVAKIAAKLKAP
ncbi:MAG: NAD(P)H-dependent oxidoreductase [Candidatus Obscuribacterales bacterium]|nr:NAD(P)H-dependent oxidoreductase [Candidatus Obscuribacterales bacterium]